MRFIGWFSLALSLLLDQVSKFYLVGLLAPENREIAVLPFFKLVMWWNHGISFGMLSHHSDLNRVLLLLMTGGITLGLIIWLWREKNTLTQAALGLIIGGALGNLIDRLHWGAVADFFYFYYKDWYWPAFNIADSCIFIGVVLLFWDSVKGKNHEKTV